jgi:hypothetical protein
VAEVQYAIDVLGQMPLAGARKARFIVIVNEGGTGTLRSVWVEGQEPVVTDRPLLRVTRGNGGIDYVFWCEDEAFVLTPQNCSCGAGLVAYFPVWGADTPVRVRMPEWVNA